jgi:hypothetical protein
MWIHITPFKNSKKKNQDTLPVNVLGILFENSKRRLSHIRAQIPNTTWTIFIEVTQSPIALPKNRIRCSEPNDTKAFGLDRKLSKSHSVLRYRKVT